MNHTKLCRTLLTAAFALLVGVAHADDTDVYLTGTDVIADEKPSILIILDNSGSMITPVPNSSEPYDKDTTYSGSFNTSRVYWTTSACSSLSSTTTQWFPAANNRCNSTQAELTNKGNYEDRYAYWSSVSGVKSWASLKAGVNNPAHVDCLTDYIDSDPNTGNLGYPTNTGKDTSNKNITGPYTTTKSLANIINPPSKNLPSGGANWSSFSQPRLCTGNYMNYLKSPAAQSKTRIQLAAQVTKDIIDTTANVRFGMEIYNRNTPTDSYNGGRIVSGIKDMTAANKTALKAIVDTIETQVSSGNGTYTPLSETLWEAYRYFAGKSVDYGDDDPTQTPARDTTIISNGNYISPFEFACQDAFIILITDGEPTKDNHANTVSRIRSLPGLGSCDNPGNISDGYCLDDLAGWMNNNDVLATRDGTQKVTTYTIRIKDATETDSGLLAQTASKGGGKAYLAETSQDIATSFQAAVAEILSITTSFAAPSLSVNAFNKLFNRNSVYFSLFKPETTARWNGNIKNFGIKNCLKTEADVGNCASPCTDADIADNKCVFGKIIDANKKLVVGKDSKIKETACSIWSDCSVTADGAEVTLGGSGSKVPARASRVMFTYTGATAPSNVALNADAHKLVDANTALTFDMLGLSHASTGDATADAATDAAARTARINWIRGQDSDPSATEDRWKFGDALHSRPLTVSYGGTEASPIIKIFVGSNDGGLRMINESTGVEEWAFIPPEMLAPLQSQLEADAKGGTPPHPYALDGTPTAWVYDKNDNGVIEPGDGDFVRIFIGMRRGGSNIYAFDVTPDDSCTLPSNICPKYMWQITGGVTGDFAKLAQTWSAPNVTYIRHGTTGIASERKAVLIFGGGYYPTQDKTWGPDEITTGVNAGKGVGTGNAIYIVDPLDGSRLWWASAPNSGATLELANMNFSIPSDIAFIDANGDGETDRLYVGDMGGQLWRLDLGATLKKDDNAGSTGARLLVVADSDYTTTADNRKFFYPPDVAQVTDTTFSSVADYDMVTIGSGDREDPLNMVPHNQLYAVRDTLINSKIPNNFTSFTVSNLYDATANLIQDGSPSEKATALTLLKAAKGWFIDLVEVASWKGEKALAPSITLNGVVYYTTYLPADPDANNTCKPQEGSGRLYALNLLNAEAATEQTGDNTLNKADRTVDLGGGIPSELVPVFQETGVTGLVGVGGGAKDIDPNIKLPRVKTFWHQ
jgi:type IV pilus assembly protein PilY1